MKYVIGNLKAHKNRIQIQEWIDVFLQKITSDKAVISKLDSDELTIIICPPFPFLSDLSEKIGSLSNISIGTQTLSSFEEGSFTGEVTAPMVTDVATYSILGHSERRNIFHETNEEIEKKILLAQKYAIKPILCIRDEKDPINPDVTFVTYEPVEAIGSGHNASFDDVIAMKKKLNLSPSQLFIYGGSVNANDVKDYLTHPEINGVLVGTASLDPEAFYSICTQA